MFETVEDVHAAIEHCRLSERVPTLDEWTVAIRTVHAQEAVATHQGPQQASAHPYILLRVEPTASPKNPFPYKHRYYREFSS